MESARCELCDLPLNQCVHVTLKRQRKSKVAAKTKATRTSTKKRKRAKRARGSVWTVAQAGSQGTGRRR